MTRIMRHTITCILLISGFLAVSRDMRAQGKGEPYPRSKPLVFLALDIDGNKELSTEEIKQSVATLLSFDKNMDAKLTAAELLPEDVATFGKQPAKPNFTHSHAAIRQNLKPLPTVATEINGVSTGEILKFFGAKDRSEVSEHALNNYNRIFGFTDTDRDGRHSKREYIDNGTYLSPQSRRGIFQASDANKDGYVSRAEYIENRIITDEAKLIFDQIDADGNNRLTAQELLVDGRLRDEKMANMVFNALDTNKDGELHIPEYLRVWGRWARH